MEYKVNLIHNIGFRWSDNEILFVKGYAHTSKEEYFQDVELQRYLVNRLRIEGSVKKILEELNGVFTFIYKIGNSLYLYSDKTRFFPIFYRIDGQSVLVTDEPSTLIRINANLDKLSNDEFRYTGFVPGNNTLIENIYQVGGGQLLCFNSEIPSKENLFSYKVRFKELKRYEDPVMAMKTAIDNAATRFITSLGNNTPVLPLSGGYDSRLIACILKEYGFNNTICFTYGRYNKEVEISKKVAERLGFKWYFIDYSKIESKRNLFELEEFHSYYNYASRLTSMFYLQEYIGTEYLKINSLIPENSIFLPGHSGDLLGGSQFVKNFKTNIPLNEISSQIVKTKFIYYPLSFKQKSVFKSRINGYLENTGDFMGYSIMEDWDIKEKIAKFIFNSSQIFTYFGYPVRFFFWDNNLVEFFRTLPPEFKEYKKLYDDCLKSKYFEKFNVNFSDELVVSPFAQNFQNFKEIFKPWLPNKIKKYLMIKNDWASYKEMSSSIFKELPESSRKVLPYRSYNSVLINWYLFQIDQNLKKK
jgi:asparagine synthase (glutamine-hydrolysing)